MSKQLILCFSAIALIAILQGCSSSTPTASTGQVVGSPNRLTYNSPVPYGMTWVPSGVMHMGQSDQDIKTGNDNRNRIVQITGFYMDATEVSNAEWRQFVEWVRDSTAHAILGDYKDDPKTGEQSIDYRKKIKWASDDVQDAMAAYYIPASESIFSIKEFNNRKLQYHYESYDYDRMARESTWDGSPNQKARSEYLMKYDEFCYPDTTVFMKMFTYSYNEPITQQYFWYKGFDNYPVVGINWNQANAFNHWRTKIWREARYKRKQYVEGEFRLPSEEDWEWAARGGLQQSPYPWGGPYIVNKKGCYLANFKPNRGNYSSDGGLYTVKVDAYWPNNYGLYNMSGNVSEWTSTPYISNAYSNTGDMSPEIRLKISDSDPMWWKRKVVRGGSWKDVAYYLQVGTRDYEFMNEPKAYIGMRSIIKMPVAMVTNKAPKK